MKEWMKTTKIYLSLGHTLLVSFGGDDSETPDEELFERIVRGALPRRAVLSSSIDTHDSSSIESRV